MKINGTEITDTNLEEFYEFKEEDEGYGGCEFEQNEDGEVVDEKGNEHSCMDYKADDIEFDGIKASISRTCEECKTNTVLLFYLKPKFNKAKMEN